MSDIDCDFKFREVNKILREINADNIPQIIVNNKIDQADEADAIGISEDVNQVSISASEGMSLSRLKEKITNHLSKESTRVGCPLNRSLVVFEHLYINKVT